MKPYRYCAARKKWVFSNGSVGYPPTFLLLLDSIKTLALRKAFGAALRADGSSGHGAQDSKDIGRTH